MRSMLQYMRNKLVNISREDENTLLAYGVLDDDLYSLWIKATISLSNLEILSIEGGWNRFTTPECWRAIAPLQEAVGLRIEPGMRQNIQKAVSRKACRHFANILLECCHTAKEAAALMKGEHPEKAKDVPERTKPVGEEATKEISAAPVGPREGVAERKKVKKRAVRTKPSGGTVIDLHVHTSPASPCSSAPVDELIEEAKRIGLDGICLTDHNYVWDPEEVNDLRQKHGFLILRGNEITTNQGDMVVFGLDKDIKGIIKLEELREEVLNAGGFMVVAHPFRGFLVFNVGQIGLTPEKAMERPLFQLVDAVEVMNSKVTEDENDFAAKVAEGLGLPSTGGSDAHEVPEVGIYTTRFFANIKDEKDLIKALKSGNYEPLAYRSEYLEEI